MERRTFSQRFDDVYFVGGEAEKEYVFLRPNGIPEVFSEKSEIHIAETGFGTGLNFFLVLREFSLYQSEEPLNLTFSSVEKYPLSPENFELISRDFKSVEIPKCFFEFYKQIKTNFNCFSTEIKKGKKITLNLFHGDVADFLRHLEQKADIWFFDGFAPSKNPEMWTQEVFRAAAEKSLPGTVFSTFSAAATVKKNLESAGFEYQKIKGYEKKRHMLKGSFQGTKNLLKKEGLILLPVMIFSLILVSVLSLWLEKTIFISRLEETFVEKRIGFIECRSLLSSIENFLLSRPGDFTTDHPLYQMIRIDGEERWILETKTLSTDGNLKYFLKRNDGSNTVCAAELNFP